MARKVAARRLLVVVGLAILLCIGFLADRVWATRTPSGLSQAAAIQIAWTHVDTGATGVISAEVRSNYQTGFDIPTHPKAWVVTFAGQWHLLCEGSCDPTTEWVAIDYYNGEWIASEYSYRAHR